MGWNQWVARATTRTGLGSLAAALALAAVGLAATPASAGIANTKHNLTAGPGNNKFTPTATGTEEICVFCHTPHGSDTSAAVPLWNRKMAGEFVLDANGQPTTTKTYNTYDNLQTSTLDGKVMSVGSVSLACLSCHDGQTSMSAVINAPGSGAGAGFIPGTWVGATGGLMPDTSIAKLGTDLRNDHPIGIQYGGGGYDTANGTRGDADFKTLQTQTLNNLPVWWVDTGGYSAVVTGANGSTSTVAFGGTAAKREKTDMILYTRNFEGKDQPFVECASCHDPHSENVTFLRIPNTGSAVCLACHIK